MKKSLTILALALGFSTAFTVAGTEVKDGIVKKDDCKLLENDAKIILSKNVSAAFACDEAAATITFGTCSSSGSRGPAKFKCSNSAAPNETPKWNIEGCTEEGKEIEVTGYKGFTLSSKGGSMGAIEFPKPCSGADLAGAVK
ncbi:MULTISPECIES: hypothetical protein [Deefgea]|uniref:Uncharacterized protein n=1 Tax=Deefgea chitinilytica TaxID=570276 RepID=A0ABS2CEE1_9NEIS|nr:MULTISPECIES: hypothetical protein [Deefgea]MBM5572520.1 hypothetical protein [Deefgea chitinilytica]MBM9889756.1 hypothetical protein [Deefgea sp. CFH1-16]